VDSNHRPHDYECAPPYKARGQAGIAGREIPANEQLKAEVGWPRAAACFCARGPLVDPARCAVNVPPVARACPGGEPVSDGRDRCDRLRIVGSVFHRARLDTRPRWTSRESTAARVHSCIADVSGRPTARRAYASSSSNSKAWVPAIDALASRGNPVVPRWALCAAVGLRPTQEPQAVGDDQQGGALVEEQALGERQLAGQRSGDERDDGRE
jgi:hypothetical protein